MNIRKSFSLIIAAVLIFSLLLSGCGKDKSSALQEGKLSYNYLSAEECAEVLGGLDTYYDNLSQKSLDYFTQKKNATKEEFIEYSKEQACDITDEQQEMLNEIIASIEQKLEDRGMKLPANASFSIASTTMNEAPGAAGYTHGTTIFLLNSLLDAAVQGEYDRTNMEVVVAHEIFHCLTRNNAEFRKGMYNIINFTVTDSDFDIPEYVHEQMIANPDVGHHDSYAAFTIDGEKKNCYLVFLTEDTFENPGDSFFEKMYTGLVDIDDGSLYSYVDSTDFYDIMGANTNYCEDPEECMATNFSYAVVFGTEGPNGEGYNSPEIIEGIINYMK